MVNNPKNDLWTFLLLSRNMDVTTIRKFLHLLDLRKEDFAQELELQNIKGEITKKIRLIQGIVSKKRVEAFQHLTDCDLVDARIRGHSKTM